MPHEQGDHVCPPWVGLISLLNPLRRLLYTSESILGPHINEGMTVIEPGPGMGYFTLTAASLVGPKGKVVALDIQEAMLNALHRRAERAGLASRLELRVAKPTDLGIRREGIADFFLAFYMVHEVPDPRRFFEQELGQGSAAGFKVLNRPTIRWSWAALLAKGSQARKG